MNSSTSLQKFFIIILIYLAIPGCLQENLLSSIDFEVNNSAEILIYLENNGDYINSLDQFAKISAQEVFDNQQKFLILDIRTVGEFRTGHIQNAINIENTEIYNFINNTDLTNFEKIIIISATGQAAGYYSALLRLYGIDNVYSLNYGMASWHIDFASIWFQASKSRYPQNSEELDNITYPKPEMTSLPIIQRDSSISSIKDLINERIEVLMGYSFHDNTILPVTDGIGIDYDSFIEEYYHANTSCYVICLGDIDLYYLGHIGQMDADGHLPYTVLYKPHLPYAEFKSINYLQTLPPNENIFIYSYNGQNSAYITAYLRLLGYNAYSILFGAQNIFWGRVGIYGYDEYYFIIYDANEFPYITG